MRQVDTPQPHCLFITVCALVVGCATTDPIPYVGKLKLPFLPEPRLTTNEQTKLLAEKDGASVNAADGVKPKDNKTGEEEITTVPRIAVTENNGILDTGLPLLFGGTPKGETTARELFSQGEDDFRNAATIQGEERTDRFADVAKVYKKSAEAWPNSVVEEDAMLMKGESHFFADEYVRANDTYSELLKKYPNSRHADKVDKRRFAIARYWIDKKKRAAFWEKLPNFWDRQRPAFDMFGHAAKTLDRLRFDNPTGTLADDATIAAGVANFEAGKYNAADILFTDLCQNFPNSEHQFEAHLLSLKCKQMIYEGPEYDGGVLEQGEKLIISMYRQFPDQAEKHRLFLDEAYRSIRLKKAQREFNLAQYYDRREEYGAAKYYYNIVKREFADTNLALESEARITELSGEPDTPPDRLAWLTRAFPVDETESKPLLTPRNSTALR